MNWQVPHYLVSSIIKKYTENILNSQSNYVTHFQVLRNSRVALKMSNKSRLPFRLRQETRLNVCPPVWPWPSTHDLDTEDTYLQMQNEIYRFRLSKLRAHKRDRQTDRHISTERCTSTQVMKAPIPELSLLIGLGSGDLLSITGCDLLTWRTFTERWLSADLVTCCTEAVQQQSTQTDTHPLSVLQW